MRVVGATGMSAVLLSLAGCASVPSAASGAAPASSLASSATSAGSVSAPTSVPAPAATTRPGAVPVAAAVVRPVGAAQWRRIVAAGMAHAGCPVRRGDLRRVEVGFWGFDGTPHRGVLVVRADVAASTAAIFTRLFAARFPIRSMRPLEDFHGDDNASMAADNTSAYNCRSAAQANAPARRSPHANGRAVDINPVENPWRDPRCRCWMPSARHAIARSGPGVIVKHGVVWAAFLRAGWIWQDIPSTIDFQHFDTGYPSRPFHRRAP